MVQDLISNVSLLVVLVIFYDYLNMLARLQKGQSLWLRVLLGILFGGVAIVGMNMPFRYESGVIYDGRSIVLVMAGLFGGGTVTLVSVVLVAAYRIFLGGNGIWAGIATIFSTALLGLAFRKLANNRPGRYGILKLYGIGVVTHIVMLACQLLIIPWPAGLTAIGRLWPIVLLIFPPATVLMGILLRNGERRLATEVELKESEARHKAILHSAMDGFCRVDLKGRILEVNEAYCRMSGFSMQELVDKNIADLDAFKQTEDTLTRIKKLLSQGSDRFETCQTRKDGSIYPVEISVQYIPEPEGYYFAFLRDITERKQAEQALRESETRYRLLVENQTDLVVKVDVDGRFLFVSPSYCKMFGKTEEELLGKTFLPLVHEEDREPTAQAMQRLFKPPYSVYVEQRAMTQDGWRWIAWVDTAVQNEKGEIIEIIGVGRDIAAQKQAEQALRESEENLRRAEQIAHVGYWSENVLSGELNWSDETCRIFGLTPQTVQHNASTLNELIHPDDHQKVNLAFQQALTGGRPYDVEYRILAADGSIRWIHSKGEISYDQNKKPERMFGMAHDITERKRAEEEIQLLNATLEERVSERTAQLTAANADLEAFAYSVSHDLRTPLRAINSFSQILVEDQSAVMNEEGKEHLGYIIQASKRMNSLIEDLLSYSRLGRKAVNIVNVDCKKLLDEVLVQLSDSIKSSEAEIELPSNLPMVQGDPTLLNQVMINLLENSIKYQPAGQKPHILIEWENGDKEIILKIRDNGIGIAPEFYEKIFNVFQRLHTPEKYPGTGIGLALAKKAVEMMNGCIGLESHPGQGSTFWVRLPTVHHHL